MSVSNISPTMTSLLEISLITEKLSSKCFALILEKIVGVTELNHLSHPIQV